MKNTCSNVYVNLEPGCKKKNIYIAFSRKQSIFVFENTHSDCYCMKVNNAYGEAIYIGCMIQIINKITHFHTKKNIY